MNLRAWILWGSALLASVPFARGQDFLEKSIETPVGYRICYTEDGGKKYAISTAQALQVQNNADRCHHAILDGHRFLSPDLEIGRDIWLAPISSYGLTDVGLLWPIDHQIITVVNPLLPGFASDGGLRRLLVRGLFKRVLWNYLTEDEQWHRMIGFFEGCRDGMAFVMEDKSFPDLDNQPPSPYREQIGYFTYSCNTEVGNAYPGTRDAWTAFWTYFCERLGRAIRFADGANFDVGVDLLAPALYHIQQTKDPKRGVDGLLGTPTTFDPFTSFRTYHRDFRAALYAKDFILDTQDFQRKYGFIDEDVLQSKINPPSYNLSLTPSDSFSLYPWCGRIYKFIVDTPSSQPVCGISVHATKPIALSVMPVGGGTPGHLRQVAHLYGTDPQVAFYSDPADPITQFGVSFAAYEDSAAVSFTATSGDVALSLLSPTASHPAYIGNFLGNNEGRRHILAGVRAEGLAALGTPSIMGLQAGDFMATVGGVPCVVQSCSRMKGDYWLNLIGPEKPGAGDKYVLRVFCLGKSVAQEDAVVYAPLPQSQVIVMDTSDSMGANNHKRLDAAKAAATIMVDAAQDGDLMGYVMYHYFGMVLHELAGLDAVLRDEIKYQISITPWWGETSVGDGLLTAQEELDVRGNPVCQKSMLLLSDGAENQSPFWSDVRDEILAKGTVVHTVALGDEGNALMQTIATATKGEYRQIKDDGSVVKSIRPRSASYAPQSLAVRLADAYLQIEDRIQDRIRLWSAADLVAPGGTAEYPVRLREGAITQAVLSAAWANAETSFTLQVYAPDGTWVTNGTPDVNIFHDATHEVYQFGTMASGSWTVVVQSLSTATSEFQVALSGRGNLADMQIWLDGSTNLEHRLAGEPIGMRAVLTDPAGPIAGAEVAVTVQHPDGTTNRFRLRDDGLHGDGVEGDGIFEFPYRRTTQVGSYNFSFQAQGQTSSGAPFTRAETQSAYVTCNPENGGDADNDGMADPWELLHGLDTNAVDAALDRDADGMSNLSEFTRGTDPNNPDTDGGGVCDGSEDVLGLNPLDELDDGVERPGWGRVVVPRGETAWIYTNLVQTNALLIEFPASTNYHEVHLYRSTQAEPLTDFVRVKRMNVEAYPGLYLDPGLENDQPYYYYLVAIGTGEQITAPSPVFSGIPKADPIPATGWVRINAGARRTSSLDVTLTFDPESDATEMLVFDAASTSNTWIPKVDSMPWTLTAQGTDPMIGTVYAQFRRGPSNNESGVSIASIEYDPDGDADNDGLPDNIDLDDDNDGIPDDVEAGNYLDPLQPDSDGDGIPDADEDPDGDGQTTWDELSGGSNPGDPDSRFQIMRIALTDGFCRVAAPFAAGRNIRLQMAGLGLENGGSWSNAPMAGSIVGSEWLWDALPDGTTLFYRVAADPYVSADFAAIDADDIAQAAVDGDSISGDDGDNQLAPGTIVLCHTSSGRFTKFLVESWGYDLGLRWATYDADGSLHSSGTGLLIRGTWACDLDEGLETDEDCDFRWDQLSGTERRLTPQNGALFLKIH